MSICGSIRLSLDSFDTKRRKKRGEEEDVCYPYRSNKKDDMRFFDASQSTKITFTHLTKGEASVGGK